MKGMRATAILVLLPAHIDDPAHIRNALRGVILARSIVMDVGAYTPGGVPCAWRCGGPSEFRAEPELRSFLTPGAFSSPWRVRFSSTAAPHAPGVEPGIHALMLTAIRSTRAHLVLPSHSVGFRQLPGGTA